jgi:hypothetical protein
MHINKEINTENAGITETRESTNVSSQLIAYTYTEEAGNYTNIKANLTLYRHFTFSAKLISKAN